MAEELSPKTYFWPYDIFGYLLPGVAVLAAFRAANDWGYGRLHKWWESPRLADLASFLGAAYVVGHVIAGLSSLILEKWIVSKGLQWPTAHMFGKGQERGLTKWVLPSYRRPYSEAFQQQFELRFRQILGIESDDAHDRFWLVWSYISLHHPTAYRRGTHFLELYGFSRNMSMAMLLIALYPALPGWIAPLPSWVWTSMLLLSSAVLFVNYTKLLRRLNDEIYRAFMTVSPAPSK